jgi:hypothetical protein
LRPTGRGKITTTPVLRLRRQTTVITEGLAGSQYLTWLPDGRTLMASGTKIWGWRDRAAGWTEVGDFGSAGAGRLLGGHAPCAVIAAPVTPDRAGRTWRGGKDIA